MATKITVALEDDLDGGPADETVRFGLAGTQYEIDLNKKNAKAFRKQFAAYVEHARKAGRRQRRPANWRGDSAVRKRCISFTTGHGEIQSYGPLIYADRR